MEKFNPKQEAAKIRETLFRGVLDRVGLNKYSIEHEYNLFSEKYQNETIPAQLVEIYNAWAEEHDKSERVEVVEYKDKFGHTKYKIAEITKEAA